MSTIFLCVRISLNKCIIKFDSYNKYVRALPMTGSLTDGENNPEKLTSLINKLHLENNRPRV